MKKERPPPGRQNMTEDERRTAAIHRFYALYRELQKYENLGGTNEEIIRNRR